MAVNWERVSSVTCQEALEKRVRENEGRIPLVLTYHPLTSRIKHILLNNLKILTTNPATATIFQAAPVVAHRRDVLVHTSDRSKTEEPGTFTRRHPRCCTCLYTLSNVHVSGPKSSTTVMNALPANQRTFCTASLAVDAPSYTSERLVELYANDSTNNFGVFKKNTGGFPVAEHFNSPSHSLSDIAVRGLRRCSGTSFRRKQLEMEIIIRLGTMQAEGLNNIFHFI